MILLLCTGLAQATSLSGAVLTEEGAGVGGLPVYAVDERLAYAGVLSGEDGDWEVSGLPAGRYRLWALPYDDQNHPWRFFPDAWRFCDGDVIDLEEQSVSGLDFSLPPGATLEGVVLDSDGYPVEDATVYALGADERVDGWNRMAISDEEGAYEVLGLDAEPGESAEYRVYFSIDGWPDQYLGRTYEKEEAIHVPVEAGAALAMEDHVLLDGVGVSGRLTSHGEGVEGAAVFVYGGGQITGTTSEETGFYEVFGLPPGEILAWASLDGWGMTYYPDADRPTDWLSIEDEGGFLTDVDLDLPLESRIVGQVENEGQDMSGVTLLAYNDAHTVGIGDTVEADGSFALGRLHAGDYSLYVYAAAEGYVSDFAREADGSIRIFSVPEEGDSDDSVISLPRGASLEGEVRDEEGEAIYGATISALPLDSTVRSQSTTSDRDGAYLLEGLFPGSYRVSVSYPVYCPTDLGFVSQWWPSALISEEGDVIDLGEGEGLALDFALPVDSDHDGMGDSWEEANGLDPTRDDAAEDPDADGLTNLEEYLQGSDPFSDEGGEGCGCGGRGGGTDGGLAIFLLPLLRFRRRDG